MPGPAAIVAGIGLVLAVVDVGFSVHDELTPDPLQDDVDKLNNKLDQLADAVDDLEGALSDLGSDLLDEFNVTRQLIVDLAIADSTALARGARDKLFEYRALANPTEAQRQAVIEDAEDALRDVIAKAQAAQSEPGAVAGFMGQMASVVATRIAVAVELEDGAIGKQSIKTAFDDVSGLLRTAHAELYDEFVSAATFTQSTIPLTSSVPLPGVPYVVNYAVTGVSTYGVTVIREQQFTYRDYFDFIVRNAAVSAAIFTTLQFAVSFEVIDGPFNSYGLGDLAVMAAQLDNLSDGTDAFAPTNASALVEGTNGNDLLRGKGGDDTLNGFDDHDVIRGEGGNDEMDGGDGNDFLDGGTGNDLGLGGAGEDGLEGGEGRDTLRGGAGDDQILGGEGNDVLQGDDGADIIEGGAGADLAFGGAGGDTLRGGEGNDNLFGGFGNDLIEGGDDNDLLGGGYGNDTLRGGAGQDSLSGDAGRDDLFGGADNDIITGAGGGDALYGEDGDDLLLSGAGADRAFGGAGNDTLDGGLNNDALFGGWGNDDLSGGGNNDRLNGGFGSDTLSGGNGFDQLTGGNGADVFVFGDDFGRGQDRITDFVSGVDQIRLDASVFAGLGTGALDPADLQTGPVTLGPDPALVYFAGVLSYDADGAGGADAVGIVRLEGGVALDAGDIILS